MFSSSLNPTKSNKSIQEDKDNGRRKESHVGAYAVGDRGSSFRKKYRSMKMNLEQEKTLQQSTTFKKLTNIMKL